MQIRLIGSIGCFGLVLAACSTAVTIPEAGEDTVPPNVRLTAAVSGETAVVDSEGKSEALEVLLGADVAVIGSTRDDGGAQLIRIEMLAGGLIEDDHSTLHRQIEKVGSESNPRDALYVGGMIQPEGEGAGLVQLRGFGRDFSGNEAHSEILNVDYLTPVQVSLELGSTSIMQGESVELSWQGSGSNASGYTLTVPDGQGQMQSQSVTGSGTQSITVNQPGSYQIALDADTRIPQSGPSSASATLMVSHLPQPAVNLEASPAELCAGDEVELTWTSENADQVTLVPPGSNVPLSGSRTESVVATTTFSLTATDTANNNSAIDDKTVTVIQPPSQIDVTKTAEGQGAGTWRIATISTEDINEACATFSGISNVSYTGTSSIGSDTRSWIRIRFEPESGESEETYFYPGNTETSVFNGMDPRGTWKLAHNNNSPAPSMPQIRFTVTLE